MRCLHDGSEEPLLNYSVATAAAPQSTQRMNKKRVVLKGPVLNPFSDLYSSTQASVEKTRRRKQNILSSAKEKNLVFSRPARTDALLDLVWSAVLLEGLVTNLGEESELFVTSQRGHFHFCEVETGKEVNDGLWKWVQAGLLPTVQTHASQVTWESSDRV